MVLNRIYRKDKRRGGKPKVNGSQPIVYGGSEKPTPHYPMYKYITLILY